MMMPLTLSAQHDKKEVNVQLQLASVSKLKQTEFFLIAKEEEPISVTLSSWQLSPKYTVKAGKAYRLVSSITDQTPMSSFRLSGGSKKVIGLLFKQKKSNSTPWRIQQLDASAANFKAGQRKVFNLSRVPIKIKYAGKVVLIKPREQKNLAIPKSLKGEYIPVVGVFLANKEKKKWRKFLSSRWVANKHTRSIMFVYAEPSTKSLIYHGLEDSIEPETNIATGSAN